MLVKYFSSKRISKIRRAKYRSLNSTKKNFFPEIYGDAKKTWVQEEEAFYFL